MAGPRTGPPGRGRHRGRGAADRADRPHLRARGRGGAAAARTAHRATARRHGPAGLPAAGRLPDRPVRARVADGGWLRSAPAGDLAVLRLEEPPPAPVRPAPLGLCGDHTGGPVSVFGHPAGVPDGVWARGRVVGPGGSHPAWRQIDGWTRPGPPSPRGSAERVCGTPNGRWSSASSPRSWRPGRAAPAPRPGGLDDPAGRPGGDGVRRGRGARGPAGAGRAGAAERAVAAGGPAARHGDVPDGRRGPAARPAAAAIAAGTARAGTPRTQLYQIVRRCGDFAEGPAALVDAVQWLEGDTIAVKDFVTQARRTWPDRLGADG
ncbi:hypothetical protein DN402_00810 [Streptomyces sp. SW4]|nr:hypothetical protein DN402_00810 [Streptomyces sp. SW4]